MSKGDLPAGASSAQMPTARGLLLRVWLGMLVFGSINLPLILLLSSVVGNTTPGLASAAVFALLVGVVAALPALVFGWRSSGWRAYAAGVLAGYVLMTIMSSGACTMLPTAAGSGEGALTAVFLYPLALIVFIVALGIAEGVAARRDR
jgi:hypothetical protein